MEIQIKILVDLPEKPSLLLVFECNTSLNDVMSFICEQTNLYAAQNSRKFTATAEEIRAVLDENVIMFICKLPNIKCYWYADEYFGHERIRNVLTRICFLEIYQSIVVDRTAIRLIRLTRGPSCDQL